jgi:hypothetical protein
MINTLHKLHGRAMAQAVSRQPLTTEARIRTRVSPCRICGGGIGTGTDFSPSSLFFVVIILPTQFHIHLRDEQNARWWPQFRDKASPHPRK